MVRYGQYQQPAYSQPIIEVDGVLRFGLPGQPLFPALTGDTILKPTLNWQLRTDKPGHFDAELAYITSGMSWEADYNLVAPEKGDTMDLVGWVTMTNTSGRSFENARIKLLAGDVNKIQEPNSGAYNMAAKAALARDEMAPDRDRAQLRRISYVHVATAGDAARSGDEAGGVRARDECRVEAALCLRWRGDRLESVSLLGS